MGSIELENICFFAYHGYYEEEAILGNEFSIDLRVHVESDWLGKEDQLDQTLNYESLYSCCKEVMLGERKKLLEKLATEICERIADKHEEIDLIKVRIAKINPPIDGRVGRSMVEYLWQK